MKSDFLPRKIQLVPPIVKKNILKRERLISLLLRNIDKKLILIIGGAGYGKTTLLAQFVDKIGKPWIFYTISPNTNFSSFLSYLITGLKNIYPNFGEKTNNIMKTHYRNIKILLGTFINELLDNIKDDFFIILDDFHLTKETKIMKDALLYLLEYTPHNIHFIISSRSKLPISVNKMRAKGEILEITTQKLKFTSKETQLLFKQIYKLHISKKLINKIEHYFEGWITGLQFFSYILEEYPPQKALDKLKYGKDTLEYFQNEVFKIQSEKIRSFLIKSSILQKMTPEVCNFVFNRNDSQQILNYLVEKNLFTSCIDEQKEIFSYHQLFRNFLLNKLSQQEDKKNIKRYYLSTATYFRKKGDYISSIKYYFLANDIKEAIKIIECEGEDLLNKHKFDVLEEWLEKIPEKILQTSAVLLMYQGEIFRWQGKWDEAIKSYKKAKIKFAKEKDKEKLVKVICGIVSVLRAQGNYKETIKLGSKTIKVIKRKQNLFKVKLLREISVAYFYLGDYRRAVSMISEAIKICEKNNYLQEIQEKWATLIACYVLLGEYEKAIQLGEQLIAQGKIRESYFTGWIWGNLATPYLITGDIIKARELLKKALKIHRTYNNITGINSVYVELGELNLVQGNYALSRLYCKRATRWRRKINKIANRIAISIIARSYLFEGKALIAEKYINKLFNQTNGIPIPDTYLIIKGNIMLELERFNQAEKILNLALQSMQKSQSKCQLMLTYTALAKLYYKKGEEKLFVEYFKKALKLSKQYNYTFALIKLGRINFSMLRLAIKNRVEIPYVETVFKQLQSEYDLIITFFGGLKIKGKDGEIVNIKWRRQKAKSLFCYLLVNKKNKFTVEQLIEILWPGEKFFKTLNRFYGVTFCVREVINSLVRKDIPFIEYKDESYSINPTYKIWTDIEEFESLLKEAREWEIKGKKLIAINRYETAISLYQGDFLPEIYEVWSENERRFYREQCLLALDKVAVFYMEKQKFDKVIEYCTRIIAMDEFYEKAYLLTIQCYIKLGAPKSALSLYNKLEKILKVELNTTPSPRIKKIIENLKISE